MSRHARDTAFGDTVNPELVSVSCDQCGDSFTTDESTAYAADQRGDELLCDDCKAGGQPAPSQTRLENPTSDETREPRGPGPDAEPDIEASISAVGFGELATQTTVDITLTYGTKEVGTITATPGEIDRFHLSISLTPGPEVLSEEAKEAIISALSLHTNLLIDIQ